MNFVATNIKPCMFALLFCAIIGCGVASKLPATLNSDNFYATTLPIYHEPAPPKILIKTDTVKSTTVVKVDASAIKPVAERIQDNTELLNKIDKSLNGEAELKEILLSQGVTINKLISKNDKLQEAFDRVQKKRAEEKSTFEAKEQVNETMTSIVNKLPLAVGILLMITAGVFFFLGRRYEASRQQYTYE